MLLHSCPEPLHSRSLLLFTVSVSPCASLQLPQHPFTLAPFALSSLSQASSQYSPIPLHSSPWCLFTDTSTPPHRLPLCFFTAAPFTTSQLIPASLHIGPQHHYFFQPNSRAPLPLFILFAQTWSLLPRCGLFLPRILPPTPVLCSTITHAFLGYVHT